MHEEPRSLTASGSANSPAECATDVHGCSARLAPDICYRGEACTESIAEARCRASEEGIKWTHRQNWQCTYCNTMGQDGETLIHHLHTKKHGQWKAWYEYLRKHGAELGNSKLLVWMEQEGKYFCKLCNKYADGEHLNSKKHKNRAAYPNSYLPGSSSEAPSTLYFAGGPPPVPSNGYSRPAYDNRSSAVQCLLPVENYTDMHHSRSHEGKPADPSLPAMWQKTFDPFQRMYFYYREDYPQIQTWEKPPILPTGVSAKYMDLVIPHKPGIVQKKSSREMSRIGPPLFFFLRIVHA